MKYLVMETHPAYAVLLDEEGRYWKAANLRYQVGDTVEDIIPLRQPAQKTAKLSRPLAGLAAMAACLCLAFFGYYQPNFTAYGTLRIQINPDVELTISRTERVLALEGLNQDGMDLIAGYHYQGKSRDTAAGELVERAVDMGYLSGGDTISITVRSSDAAWQAQEEAQVRQALEECYGEQVVIRIGAAEEGGPSGERPAQDAQVVIPVTPQAPSPDETDPSYDDTGYGPNADGVTDYADTDYGPNSGGITDYEDRDGASGGEDADDESGGSDNADDANDKDDGGDDNAGDTGGEDIGGDDNADEPDDEDSGGDDDAGEDDS